ncbi:fimbria/pilus outer membrane usher protein [Qipengyuania sp. ASV99]|uniref:fimbria/pilus outer membrane usher protein n=1 Tax=Qipengyuania sp. ASV99 TaxID=3399681 RepID=UPI003A4C594A
MAIRNSAQDRLRDTDYRRLSARPVSLIAMAAALASAPATAQSSGEGQSSPPSPDSALEAVGEAAVSPQPDAVPDLPTQRRATILSLPLIRGEDALGEINVEIDGDGSVRYDRFTLLSLLGPLLSVDGKARIAEALAADATAEPFVSPRVLADAGVALQFDMSRLEVQLQSLAPELTPVIDLDARNRRLEDRPPTIQPAGFSAYMNFAGNLDYLDSPTEGSRVSSPDIIAFGAARMGNFALQYEGGSTIRENGEYGVFRRFVRGIYDIEGRDMRISAGDLQAPSLPLLGTQLLGGIGIERRRRIFEPFEPAFQLGGQRLRISSPSTIEILNNGNLVRTIPVEQGIYDLTELPLTSGANDVEIRIRDAAGRTSVTNFNYFFDPVDLEVGEVEYGVFAGVISEVANLEPTYNGPLGASAYYRRSFTPSLLLGGALQLSEAAQSAAAEVRWVPQIVPGVFETQFAISRGGDDKVGFATRTGYRWAQNTPTGSRQLALVFDYESSGFQLAGQNDVFDEERITLNATYGQSLGLRTFLNVGLNHLIRDTSPARTNVFADVIHQLNSRLRMVAGVEYGRNDGFDTAFGARINVTYLFGGNSRLNADARSRQSLFRVGANRGVENRVGAWGYDVNLQQSDGDNLADAAFQYRGNRFDGRLLFQTSGDGFGNITDNRRAQMQLATSIAYADGSFGIGRTITDGFALVEPAGGIAGEAIVGNSLNDGEYQGRSGLFGAALVPDVLGYQTREIIYDIDAKGTVFDVGEGLDRIRVATGGGARVIIGNTRYISAVGTLLIGDAPASLLNGRVVSDSDEGFEPLQFFTNSAGRFSIIGLAPRQTYRIELSDGRQFELIVPDTTEGLYRIGSIAIEETKQ